MARNAFAWIKLVLKVLEVSNLATVTQFRHNLFGLLHYVLCGAAFEDTSAVLECCSQIVG